MRDNGGMAKAPVPAPVEPTSKPEKGFKLTSGVQKKGGEGQGWLKRMGMK